MLKNKLTAILLISLACSFQIFAQQDAKGDIPINSLPTEVKSVLEKYVEILRTSSNLDDAAAKVVELAGGTLVNEDGSLRNTIKPFSLKKDFNNVKHYLNPITITRVNLSSTSGAGYGKTAVKGKVYKVWIAKDDPAKGMPAPTSIIVPEGHPTINSPKLINIGSF